MSSGGSQGDRQPYAAPLPAVDEVRAVPRGGGFDIAATKRIAATDPYLPAHFPGQPIYPGVFAVETVRQAVIAALGERGGALPDLVGIRSLRLLVPLRPGDELRIEATAGALDDDSAFAVKAQGWCGGSEAVRMSLWFRYPDA